MAAPAPANALVTTWRTQATANNLWFDVAIANNAPQAQRNVPPAVTPMIPPPVNAAGTGGLPDCDDRVNHNAAGSVANPCSSAANPVPQPPIPAGAFYDGMQIRYYRRSQCFGRNTSHGGISTEVCRYCKDHTAAQPWYVTILNDVISEPPIPSGLPGAPLAPIAQPIMATPALAGAAAVPAWTRFLTHLCRKCEREEEILLHARIAARTAGTLAAQNIPNSSLRRRNLLGFPVNMCTCLGWLENANACIQCRHNGACRRHDQRLLLRQQNDEWLRRIERNRYTGALQTARGNKIESRRRRGVHRACRCGAEIESFLSNVTSKEPQVYMCLGCEGVVHRIALTTPGVVPAAGATVGPSFRTRGTDNATDLIGGTSNKLRRS